MNPTTKTTTGVEFRLPFYASESNPWCLYSTAPGFRRANNRVTAAMRRACRSLRVGMTRDEVRAVFNRVVRPTAAQLSDVGATDTDSRDCMLGVLEVLAGINDRSF